MLQLIDINKHYNTKNNNVIALSNINMSIKQGEIFGVIGQSGAGKSTLVRCLNLLEIPNSGKVIFNNTELTTLSKKELREQQRQMGMIFQQFNLLEQRSVLANVCFPLEIASVKKSEAIKKATELLTLVGLQDKLNAYPSQLSGGQKQRVAIARALVNNPKILLCDEATSALDPSTRNSILNLLKGINKKMNVTIVVITHEMSIVQAICDRVAVIDDGEIAEIGQTKEIFANPKSAATIKLISEPTILID